MNRESSIVNAAALNSSSLIIKISLQGCKLLYKKVGEMDKYGGLIFGFFNDNRFETPIRVLAASYKPFKVNHLLLSSWCLKRNLYFANYKKLYEEKYPSVTVRCTVVCYFFLQHSALTK